MPAKGSEDLFRLIKSLTPAEKGYFKKSAERYSVEKDNNYVKLFDLIDSQETYDEKELLKADFVNQLPRQKNYLQSLLLKSLQSYDSESTFTLEIENSIQQIRALLKRGQYELCRKLLLKTKKDAVSNEFFLEAIKLAQLENYLNKACGMDLSVEAQKQSYAERYAFMEQEKNSDEMMELEQQVITFIRSNPTKNTTFKSKLLTSDPPLLSNKAKLIFYNAMTAYHSFNRNYDKQYFYSKEYLLLNKKIVNISKRSAVLLPAYYNFALTCIENKRYKECNDAIEEMMLVKLNDNQFAEWQQQMWLQLKTFLFLNTGKFEEGLVFARKHYENKPENKHYINPRMDSEIMMNVTLIYFGNAQYKTCLKYLDALLSPAAKENAGVIYHQALLLNILTHYELGNKETVEHLVIAARRTFKNNNMLTAFEDLFLNFLKKYPDDESNKTLIAETLRDLKKVENNYNIHNSVYFFCLSWLESKPGKQALAVIIKEKAQKEAGKNYWN